ncbi:TRAP transporter small permease subunit [Roseovarius sp. TE539]|uniref:TRAP transporter small permease subunit n=1 Tax=Roseovarius sp. TE539 TaxID=2249812 RepID=UPI0015EE53B6|nr:TRAP transporter small permease [Roseovarius sp. TE539]
MRILRALERLHVVMGVLAGSTILVITLVIVADITLRVLANQPVRGATEFSTLLMIALVYLGLASVQVSKSNFRMGVVIDNLPARARDVLNLITTLIALAAIATLTWYTAGEALYSLDKREMTHAAISFPVYPARLTIALGLLLLSLQLAIDALRLMLSLWPSGGGPRGGKASGAAAGPTEGGTQ